MRLFLAFGLSDSICDALSGVQERLKKSGASVRWSAPESFHLTIKFLGDVEAAQLPDVQYNCEWLAGRFSPFRFRLRGVSYFPRRGPEIKTLWVGLTDGADEWRAIAEGAQEAFSAFGVPHEGGLVPHITLGRVRGPQGQDALRTAVAREARTDCGEQAASEIVLMQSTLDPEGAIYTEVGRWPLGIRESENPLPNT